MKVFILLGLAVAALAQDQTQSLGITATATPTASLPITPPSQRPLATCSADSLWRRLRNAQGVDPCALAMNLQQTCTTIVPIVALTGGESYTGPQNVQAATPCICTTVMYNLVAGCAACQHQQSTKVTRNWVNWGSWSALCQNRATIQDGIWNRVTGYNDTVPAWAYTKVFQSDLFDLQQAINIGVSSTATPSSTSTPSSTPTPEPQTSSKVNIIVGVVLGAVGLILLIITTIFCVLRRRQRKWEENEGVNRPDSTFVIGKPATGGMTLQKDAANRYGPGGLFSPTTNDAFEKPRPIKTETALPDVLSDEHQQGKPEYAMPAPTPGYGNPGGGFGNFPAPQTQYSSVPNPGVAGVGAGGHGLQNEDRDSNVNANRLTMRDGPQGAAAQMLAADIAAARAREGAFREDFSADGQGYQTSTDADGQSQFYRNGSMRQPFPTMPNPYGPSRNGNGNGKGPATGPYGASHPEEEVHAVSTVDDTSISLYPSSIDRHEDHPPAFVGGFSPIPERPREEYQMPDRSYSGNSGAQPSPPLDSDPFGANRRPTAFSRVFGERPGNMAGVGAGRGSAGSSPTSPGIPQGRVPIAIVSRAGVSPVLNRPNISQAQLLRGPSLGNSAAEMGFGRQHHAAVSALGGPAQRDSSGLSDGSSPTAVGFPGDIGSARGEGSPLPTGPFAGRSGFGAER